MDEEDHTRLFETFQALLAYKPSEAISCPYSHLGCARDVQIGPKIETCTCIRHKPLYPTDALRIHERFNDESGTNGEAFGYVMQVWEKLLLIHLLRCFEQRDWLGRLGNVAFFLDGPLAVFGPPAWLSAAISKELQRLNARVVAETGSDMLIVGIGRPAILSPTLRKLTSGKMAAKIFRPARYFLPTDAYIKQRVIYSDSTKRYGADTYFGRKFFYKASSKARIVGSIPFLSPERTRWNLMTYPYIRVSESYVHCSTNSSLRASRMP